MLFGSHSFSSTVWSSSPTTFKAEDGWAVWRLRAKPLSSPPAGQVRRERISPKVSALYILHLVCSCQSLASTSSAPRSSLTGNSRRSPPNKPIWSGYCGKSLGGLSEQLPPRHRNGTRSRHGRLGHRGGVNGGCAPATGGALPATSGRAFGWGDDSFLELLKVGAHEGQGRRAIDVPRL